jgi:hypothetical protein
MRFRAYYDQLYPVVPSALQLHRLNPMFQSIVSRTQSWAIDARGEVKATLNIEAQQNVDFPETFKPVEKF